MIEVDNPRVWTRQDAIEILADYGNILRYGGIKKLRAISLNDLTDILIREGYCNFVLEENA